MNDRKLATRYARALLGALPDTAAQDRADDFLTALAETFAANAAFRGFLLDPANPTSSKLKALEQLAAARDLPPAVSRFLAVVASHGRLANLASIAEVFHVERQAAQGSVSATLTTAAPIAPELAARAVAALEKLSGRKVQLQSSIDPALLGGAVVTVGSMVYDGSLKSQLDRLRRTMGEG